MNLVLILSAISLLVTFFAFAVCWRSRKHKLHIEARWIVLWFLLLTLFHYLSNILEWAGITDVLSDYENYFEVFIPLLLFLAIYSLLKETSRKQSEEALQKSQENYQLLVETITTGIQEIDITGVTVFGNGAFHRLLGYRNGELIGRSMFDHLEKDEAKRLYDYINFLIEQQPEPEPWFGTSTKKDGTVIDIQTDWNYKRNESGEVIGFICVLTDISRLKRNEETLKAEHARFVSVMDSLDAMVYVADMQTHEIIYINRQIREIFGDINEKICWQVLQVGQTGPCSFCTNNRLLDQDSKPVDPVIWEYRNTVDGKWYQCRDQAIPWPDGRLVRIQIATDINHRKLAEEALAVEKRRLSDIISGTNVGTWEWNVQTGELLVNERWAEIFGYSLNEISPVTIDTWNGFVHPVEFACLEKRLQEHFSGELEYYVFEVRVKHRNGDWIWVLDSGKVATLTSDGKPLLMSGTLIDVTSRKEAEIKLRESEEKSLALINATDDLAVLLDPDGNMVAVNHSAADIFKRAPEVLIGKCPFDFMPAEVARRRRNFLQKILTDKKPMRVEDENRGRYYDSSAYPILDDNGDVRLVALFVRDITLRKLASQEIRKRERLLKGLNESTQVLIIPSETIPYQKFLDRIGPAVGASRTYIFMNHFGPRGDMLLSQKAEWCAPGILPEIDNPMLQNLSYDKWFPRWWDILQGGDLIKGRVADFPVMEREVLDPQDILAILVIPLIVNGDFIGFIGFDNCVSHREWDDVEQTFLSTAANDLSQAIRRVRVEENVRLSLQEKEVLLREIHHRVKNNMQVVSSLLNLQARRMSQGKALDAIRESQRRISVISQVHEALYLSTDLSRISMDKYLTGVLREINSLYSSEEENIRYSIDAHDLVLAISDAIPIGLITNELVTNAFKHAFPEERKGLIHIMIRELSGGTIELLVADDGVGMPEGMDIVVASTLGLQIVNSLVKTQLGGTINIIRNEGTTFRVRFSRSINLESENKLPDQAGRG